MCSIISGGCDGHALIIGETDRISVDPRRPCHSRSLHSRSVADERRPQPRLTPFSMRIGEQSCPRWLDFQLYAPYDPEEPFHRWNVRIPLVIALSDSHRDLCSPSVEQIRRAPRGLLLEEQWYYSHFSQMYCEMFEDEPAQVVADGCEKPIPLPKRGVELGGAVDLLLRDSDGHLVLRQLELWNRELAVETFESWELTLALLRLRQTGAVQGPLRVVHADLNWDNVLNSRSISHLSQTAISCVWLVNSTLPTRTFSPGFLCRFQK